MLSIGSEIEVEGAWDEILLTSGPRILRTLRDVGVASAYRRDFIQDTLVSADIH